MTITLALGAFLLTATAEAGPASPPAKTADESATNLQPYQLGLSVKDAGRSAAWYKEMLGFREVRRMDLPDYGMTIVFLERDGFRLELVEHRKSFAITDTVPGYTPMSSLLRGFAKFAFRVDDVEKKAAILRGKGASIGAVRTDTNLKLRFVFLEDPDGNLLQIVQPIPG